MHATRRMFLKKAGGGLGLAALPAWAASEVPAKNPFAKEVGVTTGSFSKHMTLTPQAGKLYMLDLPKIMRDELGMKVIDLMTATLASFEPKYLDQLRNEAEKAGCVLTNLKMNLKGVDYDSLDEKVRRAALAEYKAKIDAAA